MCALNFEYLVNIVKYRGEPTILTEYEEIIQKYFIPEIHVLLGLLNDNLLEKLDSIL